MNGVARKMRKPRDSWIWEVFVQPFSGREPQRCKDRLPLPDADVKWTREARTVAPEAGGRGGEVSRSIGMQLHQVPIRRQAQVAFPWDLSGRPIHTRSVWPSGGAAVARGRRRSVGRAAPTTGYRGRQA